MPNINEIHEFIMNREMESEVENMITAFAELEAKSPEATPELIASRISREWGVNLPPVEVFMELMSNTIPEDINYQIADAIIFEVSTRKIATDEDLKEN